MKELDLKCKNEDIIEVLIQQINAIQRDIKELEEMKDKAMKNFLALEGSMYKNLMLVDNKIKIFNTFYNMLLSYRIELSDILFKLKEILNKQEDLSKYRDVIRELINEHIAISYDLEENKRKLEEELRKRPGIMPVEERGDGSADSESD